MGGHVQRLMIPCSCHLQRSCTSSRAEACNPHISTSDAEIPKVLAPDGVLHAGEMNHPMGRASEHASRLTFPERFSWRPSCARRSPFQMFRVHGCLTNAISVCEMNLGERHAFV